MPGTRPKTGPWPSPRYVFLGDNGKSEKDFEAATRIVDAFPKELQARATAPSAAALSAAAPPLPSAGSSPTAGCPAAGCPCARSRAAAVAQAVFLHAVSGETQPAPLPEDSEYRGVPVMHYRTYATAAVKAFDRRLLDADAARRARTATHRHRTATAPPPHRHAPPPHRHTATATAPPPPPHRHTATAAPPPPHRTARYAARRC